MIKEIELLNFQPHAYTYLELHPGVNVFKGSSHKGKSSIIRGVGWALFNNLKGIGFKSHFAKNKDAVEVGMVFDNGWIKRGKQGKRNYYECEGHEGKDALVAVKQEVPDEIQAITNMSAINFQGQDERHFLLGESPGHVGRELNKFVGLEIIDTTKTKANEKIGKIKVQQNQNTESIETTEGKIKGYAYLDVVAPFIESIKEHLERKRKKTYRRNEVQTILNNIYQTNIEIEKEKQFLLVKPAYMELNVLIERRESLYWKREAIENIIKQVKKLERDIKNVKVFLTVKKDYKRLTEQLKNRAEIASRRNKIKSVCSAIRQDEEARLEASILLKDYQKQYKEMEKKLDFCQHCGAAKEHWRKI